LAETLHPDPSRLDGPRSRYDRLDLRESHAETLIRLPESLANLLRASGGVALERAGRLLELDAPSV
jgi:hypothetical protein